MGRAEWRGTPGRAPEKDSLAYLPIQFTQLPLNKRQIQKNDWRAALYVRLDTKQLYSIKKTLNQFRWNIDMDFCCHLSCNIKESMKSRCAAQLLPDGHRDERPTTNSGWKTASDLCLCLLFIIISINFSRHVNSKNVDKHHFVLIQIELICKTDDAKLSKCYTIKQWEKSLITTAHSSRLNVLHGALHKSTMPITQHKHSCNRRSAWMHKDVLILKWAMKYSGL